MRRWSVATNSELSYAENQRLSIRVDDIISSLPTFPTKKKAVEAGAAFGWRTAIRVIRRFESCWVVGIQDFQSDYTGRLKFDSFRFPLLRWDTENGVKKCPVLKVRRYAEAQEKAL
ncbi:TPA: hypothetical protein KEY88_000082 [Serratia marcescens]|nr:hypothetical protein [Serratia marcescens]